MGRVYSMGEGKSGGECYDQGILGHGDTMACDLKEQNFSSVLQSPHLTKLMAFWNDFLEIFCYNNGELSA